MKRVALMAAVLLTAGCGGSAHTTDSAVAAAQTDTVRRTDTQLVDGKPPLQYPSKTIIDAHGTYLGVIETDGKFLVGEVDVFAGKYRNAGGTDCFWARLRSPDPRDIIESNKTTAPQEVDIQATDVAFLTQNCGIWQRIID